MKIPLCGQEAGVERRPEVPFPPTGYLSPGQYCTTLLRMRTVRCELLRYTRAITLVQWTTHGWAERMRRLDAEARGSMAPPRFHGASFFYCYSVG